MGVLKHLGFNSWRENEREKPVKVGMDTVTGRALEVLDTKLGRNQHIWTDVRSVKVTLRISVKLSHIGFPYVYKGVSSGKEGKER